MLIPNVGLLGILKSIAPNEANSEEALVKRWYNFDDSAEFEKQSKDDGHGLSQMILWETDSENDQLMLESDSDEGALLVSTPTHDDDEILFQTDSEHGQGPCKSPVAKKRKYAERSTSLTVQFTFLSKSVCRTAHMRLYGLGGSCIQRLHAGQRAFTMHEGRLKEPKHPTMGVSLTRRATSKKWPNVMAFFWYLWTSCAEILPVKFTMPCESSGSMRFYESHLSKDPDFQERYVSNFLQCLERNYDRAPVSWRHLEK